MTVTTQKMVSIVADISSEVHHFVFTVYNEFTFFLHRKVTFMELLYFVNFNQTVSILIERTVLLSGVETARDNTVSIQLRCMQY